MEVGLYRYRYWHRPLFGVPILGTLGVSADTEAEAWEDLQDAGEQCTVRMTYLLHLKGDKR